MKRNFVLALLVGISSLSIPSKSEIPYEKRRNIETELNGKWGFITKSIEEVLPQYELTAPLGDNRYCFLARKDGKWGVRDAFNREVIPFKYSDVMTADGLEEFSPQIKILDSIVVYGEERYLPKARVTHYPQYNSLTDSHPAVLTVQNPEGSWTFVDFKGEPITDKVYDEAYGFHCYYDKNMNRLYFAFVKRDGMWGAVDPSGVEVIPVKSKKALKEKDFKKFFKKDYIASQGNMLTELEARAPKGTNDEVKWNDVPSENVRVEKTGGKKTTVKKATGRKGKKSRRTVTVTTPVKYRIVSSDPELSAIEYDYVDTLRKSLFRVRKDGKWGLYQVGKGLVADCELDTIEPVDDNGIAFFRTADGREGNITAFGSMSFYPDMENILWVCDSVYYADKNSPMVSDYYNSLAGIMRDSDILQSVARRYYQSPGFSHYFYFKLQRDNPEYAAKAAKLEEKKPKKSFWDKVNSVLDKANDALNSFAEAASSNSTINKLDEVLTPAAQAISESGVNDGGSNAYAASSASSGSVSSLEGQLASIDSQIQANRQQAQQLLKERSAAKQQVRSKTYTSTKRINQSDIARNGSPSRMRSRADGRAAATVNERNRLSGINTQLDRLNREWEQLLQARKEVASQIEAASDDYSESDKDTSKSNRYKELSKESQEKVKKSGQHSQTVLGKRRALDKIADNLRDRKDNPEKYSHESSSQFRSEVRKLKEKARKIIAENNADGMEQLSFPSELLNWNP